MGACSISNKINHFKDKKSDKINKSMMEVHKFGVKIMFPWFDLRDI